MDPKKPEPGLPWAQALDRLLALLAVVQAVLPAFLVAWASSRKRDADNARAVAALATGRAEGAEAEVKILVAAAGLGRRALLDRAVVNARLRAEPPAG